MKPLFHAFIMAYQQFGSDTNMNVLVKTQKQLPIFLSSFNILSFLSFNKSFVADHFCSGPGSSTHCKYRKNIGQNPSK